mgnify:CR=1 FL=1
MLKELLWAYQRVRFGYDERIKWGLDGYFQSFIKPLEEFCEEAVACTEYMELNPERKEIFNKTLELITAQKGMTMSDEMMKQPNQTSELWKYVGGHIGYYRD